ncbi:MAG: glycosyltransferase family 2 protein [Actinobacteria bacterium]|nr:glycosyltransferase family 2 protein [Actinomycetota bacterium]
MAFPLVSIIIPNWNGADHLKGLLKSLSELNYPKESMEIIIVDNGSCDRSQEIIKNEYQIMQPQGWHALKLIENKRNQGAPAAYNQAINASAPYCEFFLKLDNDILIERNCLRAMVNEMALDERIGAIGPKIYYFNDRIRLNFAGGKLNKLTCNTKHIGCGEIDRGQYDEKCEVDFLTGCVTLISRLCVEDVGMFDEKYYWYYDELDFLYRAKRRGWKLLYLPIKGAWHKIENRKKQVSLLGSYYFTRNRLYFAWKNCRPFFIAVFVTSFRYAILPHLLKMRWDYLRMNIIGYSDFFKGRMGEKLELARKNWTAP